METALGVLLVIMAGLISGGAAWPMKLMRQYQFEHWWFIGMLSGLILIPWLVTIVLCPNLYEAVGSVPVTTIWKANVWGIAWGVAGILCGLCYVRLGIGLTTAILSGIGISLGVTLPLVVKGSGAFHEAPPIFSGVGFTVLLGVLLALIAVVLASRAGYSRAGGWGGCSVGRGKGFSTSLILAVMAGVLSCGFTLSFVYGQAPIVSALQARGAGQVPASFAVWGVALAGGALLNVGYAAYVLTRKKNWGVLLESPREFCLALLIGVNTALATALLGAGMLLIGALGGAVGTGLQQVGWMLGGQAVGFLSGEWRDVRGQVRKQIYLAVGLLIASALVMACANFGRQP